MEMTTAIILGYIGVALMVGLSGAASCIGTSIAGQASVGAMKKNGGAFGSYMILSAIPGSQGLYGFVSYFIIKGFLTESITMLQGAAIFGAGLLTGFVCLFSAYYQARICANGIAAIGNGLGYGLILVIVAFFRELFGSGSLLGFRIIPESWYMAEGGFYSNCGMMLFPPMALIIVGCIIWVHRSRNKDLQEK